MAMATAAEQLARLRRLAANPPPASSDFDLNPDIALPAGRRLRPAAVLVPFCEGPRGLSLILTKRASSLKHHPGQIAFPGGKLDDTDDGPVAAALREAEEEIALERDNVEVLGLLAAHETVTGFLVTPVIARVRDAFAPIPEPGEVEEVFSVPFSHIADPARYQVQWRIWRGRRRFYYTAPYGPYYIWGATARILRGMAEGLAG